MARRSISWSVSVDSKLLREFQRVCKERGRSQAYYIKRCMERVVAGLENGEGGEQAKKRFRKPKAS